MVLVVAVLVLVLVLLLCTDVETITSTCCVYLGSREFRLFDLARDTS